MRRCEALTICVNMVTQNEFPALPAHLWCWFFFLFLSMQFRCLLRYVRCISDCWVANKRMKFFIPLSAFLLSPSMCVYVCMLLFYINFWIFNRMRKKSADEKMVYGSMVELSNREMQYTSTTTIHHLIFRDENIIRTCYSIRPFIFLRFFSHSKYSNNNKI